jgi:hypothetical protein
LQFIAREQLREAAIICYSSALLVLNSAVMSEVNDPPRFTRALVIAINTVLA